LTAAGPAAAGGAAAGCCCCFLAAAAVGAATEATAHVHLEVRGRSKSRTFEEIIIYCQLFYTNIFNLYLLRRMQ